MTISAVEHARRTILIAKHELAHARRRIDLTPDEREVEIDLAHKRLDDALDEWQSAAHHPEMVGGVGQNYNPRSEAPSPTA